MKLQNHSTDPSVRTVLEFDEEEIIAALISYAKKQGFVFTDERCTIWFPHKPNALVTKLVIDCIGTIPGIKLDTGIIKK